MYTKQFTAGMGREEWLQLRKSGIGGSDAGAVCGLHPYSSPLKVYYDKINDKTETLENEAIRQGHDLENYVAQRFMEATGRKVRRSNYMYRSKEYSFMIADVDRLVIGEDAGLECKTASAYCADQWKDGNIPPHYLLQCYHYMAVTGRRTWYIAAVILGREFICRKLIWEESLIKALIETERNFWENYIEKGVLPVPKGSQACEEALEKYYPKAGNFQPLELAGFEERLARREAILAQITELSREQSRIEQEIKLSMKDYETAVSGAYRITWGNVETTRLDTKKLKQEKPEIYREYAKVSTSRRFRIKDTGKKEGTNGKAQHPAA